MAGDGRRSPAAAGGGRRWPESGSSSPSPSNYGGASVVQNERLKFYKKGFGERRVGPLERARRGEEDGVIVGGQGGVYGGGEGGETLKLNGFMMENEEEEGGKDSVGVVGMEEEMEEKEVKKLVVKMEEKMVEKWVAKGGRRRLFSWQPFRWLLAAKEGRKKK